LKPKWIDRVPRRAAFGLPEWLESEVNERKIFTLKTLLDRALGKKKGGRRKSRRKVKH
jgi:hypothetical protein